MTLVSTEWLNDNLSKVKILDASWHLSTDRRLIEMDLTSIKNNT